MSFSTSRTSPFAPWMAASGAAVVLVSTVACDRPKAPVARVGKAWLGQPEWAAFQKGEPGGALETLVRREVAWLLAQQQGLLAGPAWEDVQRVSRRTALVQALLAAEPGHGSVSEAMAREAWIASRERRRVSHLLVVTEAEAKAARARIEAGEPFDKVAAAVSTDPSAAQNRGDLGWIKRDQMVAPFAQAVFAAKGGDLCGPFRTEFGWHLAKVHEVQTADPAEFERTKAAVITEMQTGVEAQKKPAVLKGLRSEYPLMVDSAVLDRDRTTSPAPGDESLVAGRIAGTTISLRELKLFLAEGLRMAGSSHGLGPETKKQFMEILADDYRIAAAAEKQGLAKRADVKATVRDLERRFAYEAFAQTWIDAHRPGDEALRRHHADHPDRFCGAGSLQLHLLAFDDPARAAQAQTEAERGVSFQALLPKYANAASTGDWDAGWVEADRLRNVMDPRTMEALLGAKPGALVGPAPGPEGLMLFKVVGRKPGAPRPFEEVREAVRADYLASEGPALVARYLDGEGRQGIKVETFPANAGTPATK